MLTYLYNNNPTSWYVLVFVEFVLIEMKYSRLGALLKTGVSSGLEHKILDGPEIMAATS